MGKYRSLVVKRKGIILAVLAVLCVLAIIFGARYVFAVDRTAAATDEKTYVLLAANTSGMRCIQSDYSAFLILPPGNTIKVQVFERGKREAKLVTEGITVKYEVLNNTQPAAKNNFWQYAARYGYAAEPNIGITGNGLKGECVLSEDKKYYTASNIPVIPYNDDSDVRNPYQVAKITAVDNNSGKVIAEQKEIVLPVSDEMLCSTCHGKKTDENILKAHDAHSHTRLFDDYKKGILYKCADCHKDNAIGLKGVPEALPFSQAMHGFHADKMSLSDIKPACYSCHPGPESQCYRGQMFAAGVPCDNADCHGSMVNVALTQKQGRQAWLQEVDCAKCHGQKYAVNENQLFKNSFLLNAPNKEMSDIILCLSCHNSPHAEWESTLDADNAIPIALQDYAGPIDKCTVCHKGKGKTHR